MDSCYIFWGSLGGHFELVREWGRSCGLLGDFLGSRAPGEDFKGAGGSRGHAGISRLSTKVAGRALWALNSLPQPRRGAGGKFFRKSEIWRLQNTVSYEPRIFAIAKICGWCAEVYRRDLVLRAAE